MSHRKAGGAPRKTAVGDQSAHLVEFHRFQVGSGIEHLLHAGASARTFIADHHHVAGTDGLAEDAVAGLFLGIKDPGGTGECQHGGIHTGSFHDAAVTGDIAVKDRQPAIAGIGIRDAADAPFLPVGIRDLIIVAL